MLVDAQIDDVQRAILDPDFDLMDVPRDRFMVAGEAWAQCRSGHAEPDAFGIFDMRGLWFVAGNLLRDLAALNDREMLPWDVWGAMFGAVQAMGLQTAALAAFALPVAFGWLALSIILGRTHDLRAAPAGSHEQVEGAT